MNARVRSIIDVIDAERDRFARFCRSLSEEELARPVPDSTWRVKDFISHLATIDGPVARWFAAIQAGDGGGHGASGAASNIDRFNDAAVAARRDRSVEEILVEAATERAKLVAVLGRFTDEQLDGTVHFGGDSKRPPSDLQVGRYLQGWARHDAIHVADMLKALPERRADPLVAEWLGEPDIQTLVGTYQRAMA